MKRDQRAKGVKPRAVTDFQKDILITLHVNIDKDIADKHSPSICKGCASCIGNIKCNGSEVTINKAIKKERLTRDIWVAYNDFLTAEQCASCAHYDSYAWARKNLRK